MENAETNKWYYTWHDNTGTLSVFQTDEYAGRDGFDTKQDAINFAKKALMGKLQRINHETIMKSNELVTLSTRSYEINVALRKLSENL